MIFPIPTEYDQSTNTVYCTDDKGGTYCLAEKEKWKQTIADTSQNDSGKTQTSNNLVLFCVDAVLENRQFKTANYIDKIAEPLFDLSYYKGDVLSAEVGLFGYSKVQKQNVTASSFDVMFQTYFRQYNALTDFFVEDGITGFSPYFEMSYGVIAPNSLNSASCMTVPMKMALDASKRETEDVFDNIYVFSFSADNYDASVKLEESIEKEISEISGLHGSYLISSSASDTSKEYYNILAEKYNGSLFFYDDKDIADQIGDYINRQTSFRKEMSYINYSSLVDMSWKEKVLSGDFDSIPDIKDTDNDGLYDIEEINWELFDDKNTYSDYADEKYTGSDKAKKGIDQLLGGTEVKTKSFIPFVSDPKEYDTDNDGLSDDEETEEFETDPRNADTDGDGLTDGEEADLWFDPLDSNSDGDSFSDKEELDNDTSPYAYNITIKEGSVEFIKGALIGDFDVPECGIFVDKLIFRFHLF